MKMITTFTLLFGSVLLLGCDNSNDPAPDPGHVKVFVTSLSYKGGITGAGGVGLADAATACTTLETVAGQTGPWTAWLSDSTTAATDRIFDGGTRYQLINGTVIADNMADPARIAETYLHLHRQHRSTWTYEMVVRPWVENW